MDATTRGIQPGDRELVDNSGRKQEPSTLERSAVLALDGERSTRAMGGGDRTGLQIHARVSRQLGPAEIKELGRRRAVSGEEAVRRSRGAITRLPIVDHDHAPSTAPEHEGCEARRPGADSATSYSSSSNRATAPPVRRGASRATNVRGRPVWGATVAIRSSEAMMPGR